VIVGGAGEEMPRGLIKPAHPSAAAERVHSPQQLSHKPGVAVTSHHHCIFTAIASSPPLPLCDRQITLDGE